MIRPRKGTTSSRDPRGDPRAPAPPVPDPWDLRAAMLVGHEGRPLLRIRYGAEELLGLPASLVAVCDRLGGYDLAQVLELIGRMDAVLERSQEGDEVQLQLLAALFPKARVVVALRRLRARWIGEAALDRHLLITPPAFFDTHQLRATAVLAARVLDPPADGVLGRPGPDGHPPSLERLGEALLMVTDLLAEVGSPVGLDVETPAGRRAWTYYFAVNGFHRGSDPLVHSLARAVDLYLDPHEALRQDDDPDYVDLPALFEEATGLAPGSYMLVAVTLLGRMLAITPETAHAVNTVIGPHIFGPPWFTPAERARFFALAGGPIETFCARARADGPSTTFRPFRLLPLEQSPLVVVGESGVCASPTLLEQRLTSGLYHVLLNARPGAGNEHTKFRGRVQRFIGRVFERYVERSARRMEAALLARTAEHAGFGGAARVVRYVPEAAMRRAVESALADAHAGTDLARSRDGGSGRVGLRRTKRPATPKMCDGALVVGTDLMLLESKAQHFSLAARTGESPAQFFERLDEITRDAAVQLAAVIEHLLAGHLRGVGLDPAQLRRVIPVSVSLDTLPMHHELRAWVEARVADTGLSGPQTRGHLAILPLEPCSVGDLEWLELAVEHTASTPGDVIARKQATLYTRGLSLATWGRVAGVGGPALTHARLSHHQARVDGLFAAARAFVAEHAPTEALDAGRAVDRSSTAGPA